MKRRNRQTLIWMTAIIAGSAEANAGLPLGTAFTYQGQLKQGGVPLDGPADFQFTLWDYVTTPPGGQVGPTLTFDGQGGNPAPISVADGLFTAQLDFGADAFNGTRARWLEIAVRYPAGGGTYTTLDPRQMLTPAPFALQTRGITVDADGDVGIGTTDPGDDLEVYRSDDARLSLISTDGTARIFLRSSGYPDAQIYSSPTDHDLGFCAGNFGHLILEGTGRVAIGTVPPVEALHVHHHSDDSYVYADSQFGAAGLRMRSSGAGDVRVYSPELKNDLRLQVDGADRVTVATNGNVGIGTTEPAELLHAQSDGDTYFRIDSGAAGHAGILMASGGTGDTYVYSNAGKDDLRFWTGGADRMTVLPTGNVGIGTREPTELLHAQAAGDAYVRVDSGPGGRAGVLLASGGTGDTYVYSNADKDDLRFWVAGDDRMILHENGKIGIGVDDPLALLDVEGPISTSIAARFISTNPGGMGVYAEAGAGGSSYSFGGKFIAHSDLGIGVRSEADGPDSVGVWVDGRHIGVQSDVNGLGAETYCFGVESWAHGATYQNHGVRGWAEGSSTLNYGVYGDARGRGDINYGVWGRASEGTTNWSGYFMGDVCVTGSIVQGKGGFIIDHPTDPENKYLQHSVVESSDMMNVYTGNVSTDDDGYATITLPEWFEALNTDFRYQLTIVDEGDDDDFVQAKVVRKIEDNQFRIRTSAPNVEVSWLVTAVRQDRYAKADPIPVELDKQDRERGLYLHPEAWGLPEEMGINHADQQAMLEQHRAQHPGNCET